MPDISIQFHALPSELLPLIHKCIDEMNLHFIGILFHPFSARELTDEKIEEAVLVGPYERFIFAEKMLILPIDSVANLTEQVPGALYLDIGRESPQQLSESWLACRTGGSPINPKWKKIASWLRSMTQVGAVAVSPSTGATSRLRNHRFSSGAKELCDRGLLIRPVAGNAVLKLGQLD
jgi:hypothetical protein